MRNKQRHKRNLRLEDAIKIHWLGKAKAGLPAKFFLGSFGSSVVGLRWQLMREPPMPFCPRCTCGTSLGSKDDLAGGDGLCRACQLKYGISATSCAGLPSNKFPTDSGWASSSTGVWEDQTHSKSPVPSFPHSPPWQLMIGGAGWSLALATILIIWLSHNDRTTRSAPKPAEDQACAPDPHPVPAAKPEPHANKPKAPDPPSEQPSERPDVKPDRPSRPKPPGQPSAGLAQQGPDKKADDEKPPPTPPEVEDRPRPAPAVFNPLLKKRSTVGGSAGRIPTVLDFPPSPDWPRFGWRLSWLSSAHGKFYGRNQVQFENPNGLHLKVGLRNGNNGEDFVVPSNGTYKLTIPHGEYQILYMVMNDPDGIYPGDTFSVRRNQSVKIVIGTIPQKSNED